MSRPSRRQGFDFEREFVNQARAAGVSAERARGSDGSASRPTSTYSSICNGLSGITSVGRDVRIADNEALTDCSHGLNALIDGDGIGGSVTMQGNAPAGDRLIVGIEEQHKATLPTAFVLSRNYPNPFNPTSTSKSCGDWAPTWDAWKSCRRRSDGCC